MKTVPKSIVRNIAILANVASQPRWICSCESHDYPTGMMSMCLECPPLGEHLWVTVRDPHIIWEFPNVSVIDVRIRYIPRTKVCEPLWRTTLVLGECTPDLLLIANFAVGSRIGGGHIVGDMALVRVPCF